MSEIRKEAKSYAFRNDGYGYDLNTCEDIFSDGAEWMKGLIIQKACEWLEGKLDYCEIECYDEKKFIKDFKEAMGGSDQ